MSRSGGRRSVLMLLLVAGLIAPPSLPQPALARHHPGPAGWKTWILASPAEFRLPAPRGPRSRITRRELRELHRLENNLNRRWKKRIRYWNRGPATAPWTEEILRMIKYHRPGAFPTRTARALGLFHIGLSDAMVAAYDSQAAYHRARPGKRDPTLDPFLDEKGNSYPDVRSAIAGAAETLLTYLFPQESPDTFRILADRATASRLWAGVNYRSDVTAGRALGKRVAERVIAYGIADGSQSPWDFEAGRVCVPSDCDHADQEQWVPTPYLYQYPPTDPMAAKWKTWLLATPGQFLPPLPPAYGSEQFMDELAEMKAANDTASQADRQLAFFWDDSPGTFGPAGHWNDIALDLVRSRHLGTAKTARLFALLNAAIVDAFIATWNAKYTYWSIRPVTAIREWENIGGNPNPVYNPSWLPNIVTPPFPSYTSGHAAESAAAARVLQFLFPDNGDASGIAGQPEALGSIDLIANEVARSRMIGGIHFRSDNEQALILGRRIAGLAIERAKMDGSGL